MLATFVVILRLIGLLCRGHGAVAIENLALRQQLAAVTRTRKRPQMRTRDRLFWVCLARAWRGWRTALVVVHPDTVVRWHRQWLRRQWTRRSARGRPGPYCPKTRSASIDAGYTNHSSEDGAGDVALFLPFGHNK